MRQLQIGRQSAGFIARGHPWIRPDRFTKGLADLHLGEAVTLVDERGKGLASAIIDPQHPVCARVFHKLPGKSFHPDRALRSAWQARATLHHSVDTTTYRLVHGEGDFLPGLRIERYHSIWVVLLRSRIWQVHGQQLLHTLQQLLAEAGWEQHVIVVREQFADLRVEDCRSYRLDRKPLNPEQVEWVQERGTWMPATPFDRLATGVYVDQRATREWLSKRIAGKRVLNLFAYSGLFSIHLLRSGAALARDVDIAAPALALGAQAAERNGVSNRYEQIQNDVMAYCQQLQEPFDCIICDPPTAAQGQGNKQSQNSWVLKRDYPKLLHRLSHCLSSGGLLVACSNTLGGKPFPLQKELAACSHLSMSEAPSLALDIPQRKGFPEGRPFQIVCARA